MDFEAEDTAYLMQRIERNEAFRRRSSRILGGVAIGAVVLMLLFVGMLWRDINRSNRYRRELERANRDKESLLEAREKLMLHPWFGNIRELEHAIEKAVIICDGTFLSAGLFQLQRRNETPEMPVSTLEDMEKQMIRRTLDKCGGNLSAVASQLGITRQTLYNKMKKYGL